MKIRYSKQSKKYIEKLPVPRRTSIETAIENLPAGDVRGLEGCELTKRLRIGKFRVLFIEECDTIYVVKAGSKGKVYKRGY